MDKPFKTGLVLSGGGAIGAYQVGVVRALIQSGACVDMVAGASIGALNGALLASASSLQEGLNRLEAVWEQLAQSSPLEINAPVWINYLVSAGLTLSPPGRMLFMAKQLAEKAGFKLPCTADGLLSDSKLTDLMNQYLTPDSLASGIPLYVSMYETRGALTDILDSSLATLGIKDTSPSTFMHIQTLPFDEQKNALLASAALPLLFSPRTVGGKQYSDGGIGGWQKNQGNTPIQPLIDAGCQTIIVTHLSDGSLWDRHDFPDATILEIRPQSSLSRSEGALSGARDLVGFDPEKINSWIEQGYQDTLICLEKIIKASKSRYALTSSENVLEQSFSQNSIADRVLDEAMKRLNL
ncbi:patatin-like phospholipase family protein [Enterobacter asburiae]|nr:patatin-like phospholipase family protein [Enterobacter asburiae]